MSNAKIFRVEPSDTVGDIVATIDDPDFPGEKVLAHVDPAMVMPSGSAHVVQDEGVSLTARSNLNFVGSGVAVTDDAANDATVVTVTVIPSSGVLHAHRTLAANTNITSLSWVAVATATDLVLAASAGDLIEVMLAERVESGTATQLFQDAYSMVGGSPVNSLGLNTAAPTGASGTGIIPWVADLSQNYHPGGSIFYTVQSGDLSGGNITIRWYARTGTAGGKVISGGSRLAARNWGQ